MSEKQWPMLDSVLLCALNCSDHGRWLKDTQKYGPTVVKGYWGFWGDWNFYF